MGQEGEFQQRERGGEGEAEADRCLLQRHRAAVLAERPCEREQAESSRTERAHCDRHEKECGRRGQRE